MALILFQQRAQKQDHRQADVFDIEPKVKIDEPTVAIIIDPVEERF